MSLAVRFPLVASTVLAMLGVAALAISGNNAAAQGTATIYALSVALYRAGSMVESLFQDGGALTFWP